MMPTAIPTYDLIQTHTLTDDTSASVTFSTISDAYDHLEVRFSGGAVSSGNAFKVYFNGNTGATSYSSLQLTGNGTSPSVSYLNDQSCRGSDNGGNLQSNFVISIMNANNATYYKNCILHGGQPSGGGTSISGNTFNNSTARISSITVLYDLGLANKLRSGTVVSLYGLKGK